MESFRFPWVYLHDETQEMAIDYGALKTPHFFIFNESWKLIYTGRNTDNPRDISQKTSNDLYIALDQATKDEDISIPVTFAPRFEIDCDRSIFNIIVLSKDKIIM